MMQKEEWKNSRPLIDQSILNNLTFSFFHSFFQSIDFWHQCSFPWNPVIFSHPLAAKGCRRSTEKRKIYSLHGVNNYFLRHANRSEGLDKMSDRGEVIELVRLASDYLPIYAKLTGKTFSKVAIEYAILLRPWTNVEGKIRYYESLRGSLETQQHFTVGLRCLRVKEIRESFWFRVTFQRRIVPHHLTCRRIWICPWQIQVNASGDTINRVCLLGEHLSEGDADGELWFTGLRRLDEED